MFSYRNDNKVGKVYELKVEQNES